MHFLVLLIMDLIFTQDHQSRATVQHISDTLPNLGRYLLPPLLLPQILAIPFLGLISQPRTEQFVVLSSKSSSDPRPFKGKCHWRWRS
jgi:hypothetical protein